MMRLPDFLIIGVMKAGTTSLYMDLLENPGVFMPQDKEPHVLIDDRVLTTDDGERHYAELFRSVKPGQICGEASTGYSKRPTYEGVAGRARKVLGQKLRIIYMVREPVSRIISQHKHRSISGGAPSDLATAIASDTTYVDYSRYAWQLEPWIQEFGLGAIMVVRFEDYVANRVATVAKINSFLGVPVHTESIDQSRAFNQSHQKPVANGFWKLIQTNAVYRQVVRPLTTPGFRQRVQRAFLPKAVPAVRPPAASTINRIIDQVAGDTERLAAMLRWPSPIWDFDLVRRKYQSGRKDGEARRPVVGKRELKIAHSPCLSPIASEVKH
jgi:hypothetical protein